MNNPYNANTLEEPQTNSKTDYVGILFVSVTFIMIGCLVWMVLMIAYNLCVNPNPKFKYKENVVVVDGFYQGKTGWVYSADRGANMAWEYLIVFGSHDNGFVDEKNLRAE